MTRRIRSRSGVCRRSRIRVSISRESTRISSSASSMCHSRRARRSSRTLSMSRRCTSSRTIRRSRSITIRSISIMISVRIVSRGIRSRSRIRVRSAI